MSAYQNSDPSVDPYSTPTPYWLNKGDNAWQLTAATLVGIQSLPGLVILYGSYVKKKWAVNSTFMAMYAFAAVLLCWLLWAYNFSFGEQLLPFWGKGGPALTHKFLLKQSVIPATGIREGNLTGFHYLGTNATTMYFPMATTVYYQFVFAALTVILVAGSLLGRMNITAWMLFVPLWLTFSYTVGAFSVWGGGFLFQTGVLDYCGGYVIHLSSGIAGYTAAFWVDDYKLAREAAVHNASDFGPTYCLVKKHIPHPCESVRHPVGPRLQRDRERFPPNNLLLLLAGAGLLWLGWSGFNGGGSYSANIDASLAVINTHICAATSLLMWVLLDTFAFQKASVIGAVQGMITGLVCITPAAGFVEAWAAIIMGVLAGVIPWYSMNVLHKNSDLLKKVDDTMAVLHTHGVAGLLGGICVGLFAEPDLVNLISPMKGLRGLFYPWKKNGGFSQGAKQVGRQIIGALFIMGWNLVITSIVCLLIARVVPLRMLEAHLEEGDDAVHGEEAYALWGDGMTEEASRSHGWYGDAENGKSITDTPTSAPSTRPISLELSGMKAGQV